MERSPAASWPGTPIGGRRRAVVAIGRTYQAEPAGTMTARPLRPTLRLAGRTTLTPTLSRQREREAKDSLGEKGPGLACVPDNIFTRRGTLCSLMFRAPALRRLFRGALMVAASVVPVGGRAADPQP